jgi:ribosome-associated protein
MTPHYRNSAVGAARVLYWPRSSHEGAPLTEPADLARRIVDVLADRQAEEIVLLDIRRVASFADYFVIANAMNSRHMRALVETLSKEVPRSGDSRRREGEEDSGWVLIDYGDVIVHLFSPEERAHYALEELWSGGTPVVRIQ